jgi:hypothetical protein
MIKARNVNCGSVCMRLVQSFLNGAEKTHHAVSCSAAKRSWTEQLLLSAAPFYWQTANILILRVDRKSVFLVAFQKTQFWTIRDSRTPKNLTPDSGVRVRVDIFSGVGSGSGLLKILTILVNVKVVTVMMGSTKNRSSSCCRRMRIGWES